MLGDNMKTIRKSRGLSQQDLAVKLHVVRQTVSKWEQGLSVPDSEMLIAISEVLETPVSSLLEETVMEPETDDIKTLSEKLETIHLQLERRKAVKRKILQGFFILLSMSIAAAAVALWIFGSPYLNWNYSDPETAVMGVAFHAFEWMFVRTAPVLLPGAIAGIILTWKKTSKEDCGKVQDMR